MSINNQDDSDEYESIFADSETSSQEDEGKDAVYPDKAADAASEKIIDVDEIVAQSSMNDTDPDVDIEDGIFVDSPSPRKSLKIAGIFGAVAVLAVIGTAGFFYLSHSDVAEGGAQQVAGESTDKASGETVVVSQNVPAPVTNVSVQEGKQGAVSVPIQSSNGVTIVPDPDGPSPDSPSDVVTPSPALNKPVTPTPVVAPAVDIKSSAPTVPSIPTPSPTPASTPAPTPTPPVVTPPATDKAKAGGVHVAADTAAKNDIKAAPKDTPKDTVKDKAPPVKEPVKEPVKAAVPVSAPTPVASTASPVKTSPADVQVSG